MKNGMLPGAVAVALVLIISSGLTSASSVTSSNAGTAPQATIAENIVFIVQGETELLPGHEGSDDFYFLHITTYDLPYNVTRVFSSVPRDARNVTLMNINEAASGWTEPPPSDLYYIDVPSSVARGDLYGLSLENSTAMHQGATLTGLSLASGSLQLDTGMTTGTYVSDAYSIANCHSISWGNITLQGSSLTNVTREMSNDNGSTWTAVNSNSSFTFSSVGSILKVRLGLTGNATISPTVTSISLVAEYALAITPFTVHISYLWSPAFVDRVASLDIGEPLPYSGSGTLVVMAYLVRGYVATAQGLDLRFDSSGVMSNYPEKDFYLNQSAMSSPYPDITLLVTAPKASTAWTWYLGGSAVVVLLVAAFAFSTRARRHQEKKRSSSVDETPATDARDAEHQDDEARRRELIARKKELLNKIENIKASAAGVAPKDARTAELGKLHDEYKSVRNELNKLPKASSSVPSGKGQDGPQKDYDSSLAALSRLDEDYESKRLPEKAYRSMRKEYVERAARLKAEMAQPGVNAEKDKLLEAIAALDDEHEGGSLDEKVYKDLRESYTRELADLMRRADGDEEQ